MGQSKSKLSIEELEKENQQLFLTIKAMELAILNESNGESILEKRNEIEKILKEKDNEIINLFNQLQKSEKQNFELRKKINSRSPYLLN